MIFPFEVKFKKNLSLNPSTNNREIYSAVKKELIHISPYLNNFKINNSAFSFNVDFWGVGRGTAFAGVSKGQFKIENENQGLVLNYTYRIGSNMIIVLMFFGLVSLILLVMDFKKNLSFIPMALGLIFVTEIVFWFVTLISMNEIFKQLIKKLESNFPDS